MRAFLLDMFQKNRRGFVVWILRDEFAAKGFGEDGLCELVNVLIRCAVKTFKAIRVWNWSRLVANA